jgi:hypothetical protein
VAARLTGAQQEVGHESLAAARNEDPAHGRGQPVRLEASLGT